MAYEPWQRLVVASLIRHKRVGFTFEDAWRITVRNHPPRGRDALTIAGQDGALFDAADPGVPEESFVDATRRFCDEAWHGDRPKLRGFTLEMLREEDWSSPAGLANRHGTAA